MARATVAYHLENNFPGSPSNWGEKRHCQCSVCGEAIPSTRTPVSHPERLQASWSAQHQMTRGENNGPILGGEPKGLKRTHISGSTVAMRPDSASTASRGFFAGCSIAPTRCIAGPAENLRAKWAMNTEGATRGAGVGNRIPRRSFSSLGHRSHMCTNCLSRFVFFSSSPNKKEIGIPCLINCAL